MSACRCRRLIGETFPKSLASETAAEKDESTKFRISGLKTTAFQIQKNVWKPCVTSINFSCTLSPITIIKYNEVGGCRITEHQKVRGM